MELTGTHPPILNTTLTVNFFDYMPIHLIFLVFKEWCITFVSIEFSIKGHRMGSRKLRLNAGILQCRVDASTYSQTTHSPSNPFSTPLNKSIFTSRIQYSSLIYKQA